MLTPAQPLGLLGAARTRDGYVLEVPTIDDDFPHRRGDGWRTWLHHKPVNGDVLRIAIDIAARYN